MATRKTYDRTAAAFWIVWVLTLALFFTVAVLLGAHS